jgi:uncharacterized protein YutE (UPF0331/DUF86 family)
VNPEEVQAKLTHLANAIAALRRLPLQSLEDFRADDRNVDAGLRRLQVAIQVLIDVGSHVVAQLGLGAPETSRELLQKLESAGHLPEGSTQKYGRIFAFRNRIVHLYDRVDDATVYAIIKDDLGDLDALARHYIDALSSVEPRRD